MPRNEIQPNPAGWIEGLADERIPQANLRDAHDAWGQDLNENGIRVWDAGMREIRRKDGLTGNHMTVILES
jgi:hypothetical protein